MSTICTVCYNMLRRVAFQNKMLVSEVSIFKDLFTVDVSIYFIYMQIYLMLKYAHGLNNKLTLFKQRLSPTSITIVC